MYVSLLMGRELAYGSLYGRKGVVYVVLCLIGRCEEILDSKYASACVFLRVAVCCSVLLCVAVCCI